ncbi:MAG: cupin domain-containing protein [Alphaproteobacteria bacterium]
MTAEQVIAALGLMPHPEGGHFREMFRASSPAGIRAAATSIYYLLAANERSHWHRVDADEIWAFHAGEPLELLISMDGINVDRRLLGPDIAAGHRPQAVVPGGAWQAAQPLGGWTLVGCVVAPAFDFAGFEMAPRGWTPGHGHPD